MKIYCILILLLQFSCTKAQTNRYEKCIGISITKMLEKSDFSDYKEYILFDNKPGSLSGVIFIYENIEIELEIYEFNFTKRFNDKLDWNFDNVIKEKIGRIIVRDKNEKVIFDSKKR